MEPSTLPMLRVDLLNDVIEPVMFAHSAGPGGDVRIIQIYIYIYIPEDCTARYR